MSSEVNEKFSQLSGPAKIQLQSSNSQHTQKAATFTDS